MDSLTLSSPEGAYRRAVLHSSYKKQSASLAPSIPSAAGPADAITHRRVLRLAVPIILANIGTPLLGAVDTAVMGHLPSPAYIGGVAIGALVFSFLYWAFGFLRMATTGFIAQARGAGDHQEIRDVALRAAMLAVLLGLAVVALQTPAREIAFWAVEATPRVEALAGAYFDIRVWGAPATLLVYVGIGWLIGMERTGTVLALTLYMNGLNIALDLLFVPVLGWGIEGVALATLIAEVSTAAIGAAVILRLHRPLGGRWRRRGLLADRAKTRGILRANTDIFIRTLCLIFAFAWFTAQGAKLGETVLAANAVLFHFFLLIGHGLDGFAFAAEALVGGAIGRGDRARYGEAIRLTTVWAGIVAAVFALAYLAAGGLIIDTLTDIEKVRDLARLYLPWAIFVPLAGVWSFQLDGIYIGATRTREMRNGMALALAVYLAAGYLLLEIWGNNGLWLALYVFLIARAAFLLLWLPRIAASFKRHEM